jgi:hypothetical protein
MNIVVIIFERSRERRRGAFGPPVNHGSIGGSSLGGNSFSSLGNGSGAGILPPLLS